MVMTMKQVIKKIGKDLWIYAACILVVVFIYSWAFNYLTTIETEEKITVFIGSESASFEKAEDLNASRPNYLKTVEVRAYALDDSIYDTCLSIFGYETGDVLILPESNLKAETCADYYAEISMDYQSKFNNLGWYEVDGKVYGIRIHDKETHQSIIDSLDYGTDDDEQNYYLLFNKNSMHLSDLSNADSKSDMNGAIMVANLLLSM